MISNLKVSLASLAAYGLPDRTVASLVPSSFPSLPAGQGLGTPGNEARL